MSQLHVNDIGSVFRVTVMDDAGVVNLADATVLEMIFDPPGSTAFTRTAVLANDGTDGIIVYTTVDGDLSKAGTWSLQVRIVTPYGEWRSTTPKFKVYANLS